MSMATWNMWVSQPAVNCPSGIQPVEDSKSSTSLKMDVAMKALAHTYVQGSISDGSVGVKRCWEVLTGELV